MPAASPLTDWVVLAVMAEAPRHGFAVAKELAADAVLGEVWTVPRPLVYRAIDHLRDAGLVAPARTETGTQGPHRTVYRVTRSGSARLRRWLDEPVTHPRDVRTELLVKLVLRARRGRPLAPLAQAQLDRFASATHGLAQRARRADGAEWIAARWRVESLGAIRRTLEAIVAAEALDATGPGAADRSGR
ncbi:MAG: PadR family transcriptional regulator [Actinomycetota bacterium]